MNSSTLSRALRQFAWPLAAALLLLLIGWFAMRATPSVQPANRPDRGPAQSAVNRAPLPADMANVAVAPQDDPVVSQQAGSVRQVQAVRAPASPAGPVAAQQTVAPAAAALLPAGFLDQIVSDHQIAFTLPDGRKVRGEVKVLERDADGIRSVEARLSEPAAGNCVFQRQTVAGVAGPMAGHVRFDGSDRAWKIEPTVDLQSARLVERDLDAVVCVNYSQPPAAATDDDPQQAPQTHPTNIPIPPYQAVIPLQSLPGATGVLYLDFDGENATWPYWGAIDAAPSGATNAQVYEVWKMVCEDYQGFNLNVTTDRKVFDSAQPGRRQHIILTPTTTAAPGAGGVAYVGSFNWSDDVPCWSFYSSGKSAAEVVAHELGHTLGLGHDGRISPSEGYYTGHGSGDTGWAPIMGAGYYKNLTQWSKGEYLSANNTQDDLSIIANNNNNVGYRTDDTGSTLATARYLEVLANGGVANEGIIERTGDVDAFRFRSNGGQASLTISPVSANPDLDVYAEIVDATSLAVIVSNNPDVAINATLTTTLPAGEYLLRVRGTGRGDPLVDGYTAYGSLGTYLISGTVSNSVLADRFAIVENSANGTAVGTVAARNSHGANPLTWAIASGNTNNVFAINAATGAITVANSSALNYEAFSARWDDPADVELFVTITDATNPALNESIRTVITLTDVNEAPAMTAGTFTIYEYATVGSLVGTVTASDPDRFDYLAFSILDGDPGGLFTIDAYTGAIRVATAIRIAQNKTFNLVVRAVDQGNPALATTATFAVQVLNVTGQTANIAVSCDNRYELYVNGTLIGSGSNWNAAGQYSGVALVEGNNVIAIKGMDDGGIAGLIAEIVRSGTRTGTGTGWKASLAPPSNWKDRTYDDSSWAAATDHGTYGISPWYTNISGIASDTPAHWIWSSNNNAANEADNTVYFRYSLFVDPETSGNDAPVISQGDSTSVLMNKDATPTPFSLTLNATDANGDVITWSVASAAAHGTASVSGTGTSQSISYTPAAGYTGSDSFVVQAADGNGGVDTITVNVTIRAIEAEVPGLLAEFFDYSTSLSLVPDLSAKTADVTRVDTQINYASTSSAWTGLPSGMAETFVSRHRGKLRVDTAGSYTLYLESDDGSKLWLDDTLLINNDGVHGMTEVAATVNLTPGLHILRVEFFENTGGAGLIMRWAGPGITKQVVPASVLYQPDSPNVVPVANPQAITTTNSLAKAVTLTGSDADGDPLTYTIVTQPSHGTLSGTAPNVIYTPATSYTGSDSFTFKVNDGLADSLPATVSITVVANVAPVADAQSITTNTRTPAAIILTASDANDDTLTYSIINQPAHGALSGTAPNVTYTPTLGYSGGDAFTFKVNDGTVDSPPATVSITVLANDAPVASPQSVATNTRSSRIIFLTAEDANADPLAYTVTTQPVHGMLSGTPPNVTYTPSLGYVGSDAFTFQADDGLAISTPATVSITVLANDVPVATAQSITTNARTARPLTLTGSDLNGDSLTYVIVSQPSHGTLSGTPPNVIYSPTTGYSGSDAFTFKVNDGLADSAPATVSITVLSNHAPVANDQTVLAKSATAKAIALTATDANGDTLTYLIVSQPSHGTLTGTAPNVTYTSTSGYSGSDAFTFKANDGLVDSAPATVTITVYQGAGPTAAFWAGGTDANWSSAANWKTTVAGGVGTGSAPANQSNVTFNTTTPVAANLTNTLDADFHINSLAFATTATSPVTLGGTKRLVLGAASGNGITVNTPTSGTVAHVINTDVALAANQTWTVNSASASNNAMLTVNGGVSDSGAGYTLTKAGAGTLNLNGPTRVGNLLDGYRATAGSLIVGNGATLTVGNGSSNYLYLGVGYNGMAGSGTLDVSAGTLNADVGNFYVGINALYNAGGSGLGTNGAAGTGTLRLGNSNIKATRVVIGGGESDVNSGITSGNTGTVTTAAGSLTVINTPYLAMGTAKGNSGSFTAGSGATLTLGSTNSRTELILGRKLAPDSNAGNRSVEGTMDLGAANAVADLNLSSFRLSYNTDQLTGGYLNGTMTLSASGSNHLDVTGPGNVIAIGCAVGTASNFSAGTMAGTLTLGNVNATSAITSTDNSTAILIGAMPSGAAATVSGTLNLNGGTLTITTTSSAIAGGNGTSNLNLDGGVTLKAGASSTTWIQGLSSAKIRSGGVVFDTNGNAITVNQPLLDDASSTGGGLTKAGAGTLTLGGSNTYTGATVVTGGTLALGATGTLATSASLNLAAGTQFDTTAQATYAVPVSKPVTLHLSGAGSGSSGKLTASGLNITNATVVLTIDSALDDHAYVLAEYSALTGSAFASVTSPPEGYTLDYAYEGNKIALVADAAFNHWINGFQNLSNISADADPDGDGLANAMEYVLGTDPRYGNSGGPKAAEVGDNLVVTFNRSDAAETPDVSLVCQVSTDLSDWTSMPGYAIGATKEASSAGVDVAENGAAPDTITVTIPKVNHAKTFARLRVVVAK